MAIGTPAHLNAAFTSTSTAAQVLSGITAASGDLVFVTCADDGSTSTYAVTDSAGNSYTPLGVSQALVDNYTIRSFYSVLGSALAAGTITGTKSGGTGGVWDRHITAEKVTMTTGTPDQIAQATGTGTAWSSAASPATGVSDEIVFGLVADGGAAGGAGNVSTPAGGATELFDSGTASAFIDIAVQYLIVASTGAQTQSGTLSNSDTWAASAFTFSEGAAPAAAPVFLPAFNPIPFMGGH